MRWRSKRRGDRDAGGHVTSDGPPAPSSTVPGNGDQGWSALPPIASTWSPRTPLTATPTTPITALRPPLTQETHRASAAAAEGAPDPGRVVGLAAVARPRRPEPAPHVPEATGYFPEPPPLRHAAVRPTVVEAAPLTRATPDYVGEPAAPAPPPPAPVSPFPVPARTASSDPAVEATTEAGARFREALANLHKSGLPRYEPGPGATEPPTAPPPAPPAPDSWTAPTVDAPPAAAGRTPPPPLTHRRSLAESRRLGLGAPVKPTRTPEDALAGATAEPRPAQPPSLADALLATPPVAPPAPPEPPAAAPTPPSPSTTPHRPASGSAEGRTDDDGHGDDPDSGGGGSRPTGPRPPITPAPVVRPIADPAVRPTASAVPLVFRSTPRPVIAPAEPTASVPRATVTRPPTELAQALRSSHGVDVADVPVRRDAEVADEARRRRARAFTRDATVHLPDDAGTITSPRARGLLAHELVHAAQQRRLGDSLPAADTAAGRALEVEALQAERMYGGEAPQLTAAQPLRHAPVPVTSGWVEDRLTQLADVPPPTWTSDFSPETQQEIAYIAQEQTYRIIEEGGLGGGDGLAGGRPSSNRSSTGSGVGTRSGSSGPALNSSGAEVALDATSLAGHTATRANEVGVGVTQATTYEEFETAWLNQWSIIRSNQGLGPMTRAMLTADDRAMIRTRWDEAVVLKQQDQANRDRIDEYVAQVQRPGAGTTTPGGLGSAGTGSPTESGTGGTGDGRSPGTGLARTGTGGTGRTGGAGLPGAGPAAATGLGIAGFGLAANAGQVGVGIGQATDLASFKRDYRRQLNLILTNQGLAEVEYLDPESDQAAEELFNQMVAERQRTQQETQRINRYVQSRGGQRPGTTGTAGTTGSTWTAATPGGGPNGATGATTGTGTATAAAVAVGAETSGPRIGGHRAVVARAETRTAPTHEREPVETDDLDLEELSARLYDRLRSKLRAELLIDRERAGLLTDFR